MNYRYSPSELHHLYKTSRAKALIFNRQFSLEIKDACARNYLPPVLLEVDGNELGLNLVDEITKVSVGHVEKLNDTDLIIIFTGGTTGYPKGVMWPHKHLFFFGAWRWWVFSR
ncbi:AMP-binding protein [Pseudomonadales bacterium]|nr:AMP-binding protein [Pseudomonadales bacterium]